MPEKIKEIINDPEKLEKFYREDRRSFESDFEKIYPEIQNSETAKFWKTRLEYDNAANQLKKIFGPDLFIMAVVCLFAGFLIKIPEAFNFDGMRFHFIEKETGLIIFLALSLYSMVSDKRLSLTNIIVTLLIFIASGFYINLLPYSESSSSVKLVLIHMPLLLWCLYGLVYIGFDLTDYSRLSDYIKHNRSGSDHYSRRNTNGSFSGVIRCNWYSNRKILYHLYCTDRFCICARGFNLHP